MNSTVVIILAIVALIIYLAIRYGVYRILDKAGNAIEKKIVDHKNANQPAEIIKLADLYPDLAASLQRNSSYAQPLNPNSAPVQSIPQQNMVSSNKSSSLRNSMSRLISTESVQSIPGSPVMSIPNTSESSASHRERAFPLDRCCICGRSLANGHAVLFSNAQGEARVDENCCNGIALMAQGNNKQEVYQAVTYFSGVLPNLQPAIVDYLRNYLLSAQQFLQS